jgi:hypothetical protein
MPTRRPCVGVENSGIVRTTSPPPFAAGRRLLTPPGSSYGLPRPTGSASKAFFQEAKRRSRARSAGWARCLQPARQAFVAPAGLGIVDRAAAPGAEDPALPPPVEDAHRVVFARAGQTPARARVQRRAAGGRRADGTRSSSTRSCGTRRRDARSGAVSPPSAAGLPHPRRLRAPAGARRRPRAFARARALDAPTTNWRGTAPPPPTGTSPRRSWRPSGRRRRPVRTPTSPGETTALGDFAELVAASAPPHVGYGDLGRAIEARGPPAEERHARWIGMYADEEFIELARWCLEPPRRGRRRGRGCPRPHARGLHHVGALRARVLGGVLARGAAVR